MKNAAQFQECIRHLLCMSNADFKKVFGESMGEHLRTSKLYGDFKGDAARFICYLDGSNIRALFAHFQEYLVEIEGGPKASAVAEEVKGPIVVQLHGINPAKIAKENRARKANADLLARAEKSIDGLTARELSLAMKLKTQQVIGPEFDEEVYKKARAKAARWNANAYGSASDWENRVGEAGLDCLVLYYRETLADPSGQNTDNNRAARQWRRDNRRAR